jgi:ribosomal protein L40E
MLDRMKDEIPLTQEPDIGRLLMICDRWGCRDVPELINRYLFKEACPAICMRCGIIAEKPPDTLEGRCPKCDSDTMRSALVLAGIL